MPGSNFSIGHGTAQNSTTGGTVVAMADNGATVSLLNPAGLTVNEGDGLLYVTIVNPTNGTQVNVLAKDN